MAADRFVKFNGQDFIRFDDNPPMEGNVMALDIDSKGRVWFAVGGFNHGGLAGWMAMPCHFTPRTILPYRPTG